MFPWTCIWKGIQTKQERDFNLQILLGLVGAMSACLGGKQGIWSSSSYSGKTLSQNINRSEVFFKKVFLSLQCFLVQMWSLDVNAETYKWTVLIWTWNMFLLTLKRKSHGCEYVRRLLTAIKCLTNLMYS